VFGYFIIISSPESINAGVLNVKVVDCPILPAADFVVAKVTIWPVDIVFDKPIEPGPPAPPPPPPLF